jgi:carboxylesterase
MAGAEPFSHKGNANGVLVLHGFTGSPQSMRPQADALADAGFSVELPLLPGHGTAVQDMVPTRWKDWSTAAEKAYVDLAARTEAMVVVALSMGGTLACWLAEHHPDVLGLVLINPYVEPPAESYRDILRGLVAQGIELGPAVGSDIAKEGVVELAYESTPIQAGLSLFEGIDLVAGDLGRIQCPVLLFSSRQDHVVPSSSGDLLVAEVSSPVERVWLEQSFHVATLDNDGPEIVAGTVAFVTKRFAEGSHKEVVAESAH